MIVQKEILRQGASGQTVQEAQDIICANCGIPNDRTMRWSEIYQHADGYEYIGNITNSWNNIPVEQMLAGITLDRVIIDIEEGI